MAIYFKQSEIISLPGMRQEPAARLWFKSDRKIAVNGKIVGLYDNWI